MFYRIDRRSQNTECFQHNQPCVLGDRVCNPGHPAPEIRSVGLVLLAAPSVLEASPALHSQPSPPGSGPAVPAWGIGLPSPAELCVGVSTEQAPSPDVLKVSSSRSLHDWRGTRCPQVSTSLPRGLYARSKLSDDSINMRFAEHKGT